MPGAPELGLDLRGHVLGRRHRQILVARRSRVEPDLAVERHPDDRTAVRKRGDAAQRPRAGPARCLRAARPTAASTSTSSAMLLELRGQRLDRGAQQHEIGAAARGRLARRPCTRSHPSARRARRDRSRASRDARDARWYAKRPSPVPTSTAHFAWAARNAASSPAVKMRRAALADDPGQRHRRSAMASTRGTPACD